MISLAARYIDYGLTGGFFLFVAMAVFGWYHPAAVHAMLENFQKNLPAGETKALETLLNGIFASLFVVCVFATGLLLDLVGSLLIVWELGVFQKHLKRNKAWIGQLLAKYEEFLGEDMNQVLKLPNCWKQLDPRLGLRPLMLIAPFGRIESILLSHLLLTADPTKLEMVMDQVRTCRIARAVSSGLIILSIVFSLCRRLKPSWVRNTAVNALSSIQRMKSSGVRATIGIVSSPSRRLGLLPQWPHGQRGPTLPDSGCARRLDRRRLELSDERQGLAEVVHPAGRSCFVDHISGR